MAAKISTSASSAPIHNDPEEAGPQNKFTLLGEVKHSFICADAAPWDRPKRDEKDKGNPAQ